MRRSSCPRCVKPCARCGNRLMPGPTLHAAWEGLLLVFSWPNILYPIAGTLLAMAVAFLPGISGVTLMALAVPFTLTWEPLPVMLTFGGMVGGATFMGSITAILFNVPGPGPSAEPKARWKRKSQKRSAKIGNAEGERNQAGSKIARNCEDAEELISSEAKKN